MQLFLSISSVLHIFWKVFWDDVFSCCTCAIVNFFWWLYWFLSVFDRADWKRFDRLPPAAFLVSIRKKCLVRGSEACFFTTKNTSLQLYRGSSQLKRVRPCYPWISTKLNGNHQIKGGNHQIKGGNHQIKGGNHQIKGGNLSLKKNSLMFEINILMDVF